MKEWWNIYKNALPTLTDDHKKNVEDITGCIPLLLRALLRYPGKDFKSVESDFLSEVELQNVIDQMQTYATMKKQKLNLIEWNSQV